MRINRNSYSTILSLISNLLLVMGCFIVCRITFLLVNLEYYPNLSIARLLEMFKGGWVFDTSAILYTNILYILMMIIPLHFKENIKYQKVARGVFVFCSSVGLIANLMDVVYFQYTSRRTTASIFQEFSNENNIGGIIGTELVNHWYLTILAILMIYGLYKFYFFPKSSPIKKYGKYYAFQVLFFVLGAYLCVGGMRGGLGYGIRPITISNANQYVDRPIETAIVLNTPFAIYRTLGKATFVNPHYFADKEEMQKLYSPVHMPNDSVKFKPMNVVVLILESFGKEYSGYLNPQLENGNYKGYTPFLDSLIQQSVVFEHSFCNGRKSIDGMPSVLSGIPMFIEPFFLTKSSLNTVSGLAGELGKKGYYTAFFHGGRNGSMGFEAYARTTGYDDYFGKNEYNNDDDFDGHWGIWDEPFFQYYAKTMTKFKQPFLTSIFSLSSHHPFKVPEQYEGVFPKGNRPIHQCVGYSDNALRKFFATASKQPWFKNTLFVLTADHTNQNYHKEYQTAAGLFKVPVIFYQPGNKDFKGMRKGISQQIDIMPTVLNYLGYDKPYVSFGCDLFNTPQEETFAVNYLNGYYQYIKGNYLLQFNGKKSVAVYDYVNDRLFTNNLVGKIKQQEQMEKELKSMIQQYMERMSKDKLVYGR